MKVTKAQGSSSRTTSTIDLGIEGLPSNIKRDIIQEAGEFLVEQTLLALGDAESPVSGESFPALSKEYKAKKVAEGGRPVPDMEGQGNLKDALTFRPTANGLEIGFFGGEADKADGHLKFSGRKNDTPKRRFLPGEDQSFKRDIVQEVDRIVTEKAGDVFSKSDFSGVESEADLYDILGEQFGGLSRYGIRDAVISNEKLMGILVKLNLLRFL